MSSVRGETVVAPDTSGHTSIESIGGTGGTAAAAFLSVGSTPARPANLRGRAREEGGRAGVHEGPWPG